MSILRWLKLSFTVKAHLLEALVIARADGKILGNCRLHRRLHWTMAPIWWQGMSDIPMDSKIEPRSPILTASKWEYGKNNSLEVKESEAVGSAIKRKVKVDKAGQTAKMQRTITAKRQRLEKRRDAILWSWHNFTAHLMLTTDDNTKLDYKCQAANE